MTDALSAPVALAVLATLSVDLLGAVVLGGDGSVLAGDAALEDPTRALLAGVTARVARQAAHTGGRLYAARDEAHALALLAGPHALEAVVVHDLLTALDDLRGC